MSGITNPDLQRHRAPSSMTACVIQDDATDGPFTLVAGVAGRMTDVWGLLISAAGTTVVSISTGSTAILTFAMVAGSQVFVPIPYGPAQAGQVQAFPLASTADGDDLKMSWTGSIAVCGVVYASQRQSALI